MHFWAPSPSRLWYQQMWLAGGVSGVLWWWPLECERFWVSITPAVRPLGERAPQHTPVARLCCHASNSLWWAEVWTRKSCQRGTKWSPEYPQSDRRVWFGREMVDDWHRWCEGSCPAGLVQAIEVPEELGLFPVDHFLMREELSHALFAWGGQPAHQLCCKPVIGIVLL